MSWTKIHIKINLVFIPVYKQGKSLQSLPKKQTFIVTIQLYEGLDGV